jgi:antitoxin component of RelBE/YafQ-DinJ toxin-antitoxin module
MKDHAQATIELINAAIAVAENVPIKLAFPLELHEARRLQALKNAVDEYKQTKKPKRVDDGDDFDSLHGCS